jgi:uncharacterized membrane protein YdfJ with MMPL/SSD domain
MLLFYRFLGLVADVALVVYGILLWGLFNAIPVTLTLPGVAGLILTIGVAADANVVIFERIKEEVRQGKTVRSAVNSGYARGFKTILDANILVVLTALVLFFLGTASPKGFALTLILGVLVSMVTAVLFTRAMLSLLSGFAFLNRPALVGVGASQIVAVEASAPPGAVRRRGTGGLQEARTPGTEAAAPSPPASSSSTGSKRAAKTPRRTSTSRSKKRR